MLPDDDGNSGIARSQRRAILGIILFFAAATVFRVCLYGWYGWAF
jgi:hypothetical protein